MSSGNFAIFFNWFYCTWKEIHTQGRKKEQMHHCIQAFKTADRWLGRQEWKTCFQHEPIKKPMNCGLSQYLLYAVIVIFLCRVICGFMLLLWVERKIRKMDKNAHWMSADIDKRCCTMDWSVKFTLLLRDHSETQFCSTVVTCDWDQQVISLSERTTTCICARQNVHNFQMYIQMGGLYNARVATEQGKQGIWFLLFPDRENREFCCNTGKIFETQGKYFWLYLSLQKACFSSHIFNFFSLTSLCILSSFRWLFLILFLPVYLLSHFLSILHWLQSIDQTYFGQF